MPTKKKVETDDEHARREKNAPKAGNWGSCGRVRAHPSVPSWAAYRRVRRAPTGTGPVPVDAQGPGVAYRRGFIISRHVCLECREQQSKRPNR